MSNHAMIQFFEWNIPSDGLHWKRLKDELPFLNSLGITGYWLPPFCKATSKGDDAGYGCYDLWDLGEFDQKGTVRTKYGTKKDLMEAMEVAQKLLVQVYGDIVLNHKMGADEQETFKAIQVADTDRTRPVSEPREITAWTKYTFPGRKGIYSDFVWTKDHFNGTDYDVATQKKAIFKILGKEWSEAVDHEYANFDFLMGANIDYKNPEVVAEIKKWAIWVVKHLGLSGFRIDAIKHIDAHFIHQLVEYVSEESQNPNFFTVGEYWSGDVKLLCDYLKMCNFNCGLHLFDVPLRGNFEEAAEKGKDYDMRKIFDGTLVQACPMQAVTFVDNHDSQPGGVVATFIKDWFKPIAYSLILLRAAGYPCVFYGDYYGIGGKNPIPGKKEVITKLLMIRRDFAYGVEDEYFDHPTTVGWVRRGEKDSQCETHRNGCAVIICTGDAGDKRMFVGEDAKGQVWVDLLGHVEERVTIGDDGFGLFKGNGGSVSVWAHAERPLEVEINKIITASA